MAVTRYQVEFEPSAPAIEQIAKRFRELTGLELSITPLGTDTYEVAAAPLSGDVDLRIGDVVAVYISRIRIRYLEAALMWTLHSLGGQVPLQAIPKYAQSPWASLPRYKRFLHR